MHGKRVAVAVLLAVADGGASRVFGIDRLAGQPITQHDRPHPQVRALDDQGGWGAHDGPFTGTPNSQTGAKSTFKAVARPNDTPGLDMSHATSGARVIGWVKRPVSIDDLAFMASILFEKQPAINVHVTVGDQLGANLHRTHVFNLHFQAAVMMHALHIPPSVRLTVF